MALENAHPEEHPAGCCRRFRNWIYAHLFALSVFLVSVCSTAICLTCIQSENLQYTCVTYLCPLIACSLLSLSCRRGYFFFKFPQIKLPTGIEDGTNAPNVSETEPLVGSSSVTHTENPLFKGDSNQETSGLESLKEPFPVETTDPEGQGATGGSAEITVADVHPVPEDSPLSKKKSKAETKKSTSASPDSDVTLPSTTSTTQPTSESQSTQPTSESQSTQPTSESQSTPELDVELKPEVEPKPEPTETLESKKD